MTKPSTRPLYDVSILDILKKYSSKDHPLTQKDIIEKLESDYELTQAPATIRKTINRNLKKLVATGYPIAKTPKSNVRLSGGKEPRENQYDWYYQQGSDSEKTQFEESELRFLLDSIASSSQIPSGTMRQELLGKIAAFGDESIWEYAGILGRIDVRHREASTKETNKEFFLNLELIDEAIKKGCAIQCNYNHFAADGKLHPRINDAGAPMDYKLMPFFIINQNAVYYLVAQTEGFSNLSFYRIDRITSVDIANPVPEDGSLKPSNEEVSEALAAFLSNRVSLYPSEKTPVKVRVPRDYLDPIMDDFPLAKLVENRDSTVTATFRANKHAMISWTLKHRDYLEVLEPKDLRDSLYRSACAIKELYQPQQA